MPLIDQDAAQINAIRLVQQSSDPAAPSTGGWKLYVKSGGLFIENAAGSVTGPFGTSGASGVTTELLAFTPSADQLALTTPAAGVWIDACANQTFTVTDAGANIWVFVIGIAFCDANSQARINVDSGGTPITRVISGMSGAGPVFSGCQPVRLGHLSAGTHTVKVQFMAPGGGQRFRLNPTSNPPEFLDLRVYQGA